MCEHDKPNLLRPKTALTYYVTAPNIFVRSITIIWMDEDAELYELSAKLKEICDREVGRLARNFIHCGAGLLMNFMMR